MLLRRRLVLLWRCLVLLRSGRCLMLLLLRCCLALLLLLGSCLVLLRCCLVLLLLRCRLTLLLLLGSCLALLLLLRSRLTLLLLLRSRLALLLLLGSCLTLLLLLGSCLALMLLLGSCLALLLLLRSFLALLLLLRSRLALLRCSLIARLQRRWGPHIAICSERLADGCAGWTALVNARELSPIGAGRMLILHLRRHGRRMRLTHRRQFRGSRLHLDSARSAVETYPTAASAVAAD